MKPNKQQQKPSNTTNAIVLVIILVIIALIVNGVSSANKSFEKTRKRQEQEKAAAIKNPPVPEPPKATYEATLTSRTVEDPATLVAGVHVRNTSNVAGTPSCFVSVSNSSKTYKGYDTFTPGKLLQPGEEYDFNARIIVTKEGAYYATDGSVSCT